MATPSPAGSGVKGWMRRGKEKRVTVALTPAHPPSDSEVSWARRVGRSILGRTGGAVAGPANSSAGQITGLLNVLPTQQNTTPSMSASDSHLVVVASTQPINMVRPGTSSSHIQHPPSTAHGSTPPAIVPQTQLPGPFVTPMSPCTLINR